MGPIGGMGMTAGNGAVPAPGGLSASGPIGVYFRPRMAEEKQGVPVPIGADEWGRQPLLDPQRRGLTHAPDPAIGDRRSAMLLWGSGMRCARLSAQPGNSAAGSMKPAMC